MTPKKRDQIIEMWSRGKNIHKISRELRLWPLEVAEVINNFNFQKEKEERTREVFKYDRCY